MNNNQRKKLKRQIGALAKSDDPIAPFSDLSLKMSCPPVTSGPNPAPDKALLKALIKPRAYIFFDVMINVLPDKIINAIAISKMAMYVFKIFGEIDTEIKTAIMQADTPTQMIVVVMR